MKVRRGSRPSSLGCVHLDERCGGFALCAFLLPGVLLELGLFRHLVFVGFHRVSWVSDLVHTRTIDADCPCIIAPASLFNGALQVIDAWREENVAVRFLAGLSRAWLQNGS